ncbi:hypothetical protein O3G_MSEX009426 [Manduca sexta]|uniref:Uncharacterized protein n=1 Tax=Manduca sexta TaxID=7130 RepID=A0A921ZD87_MANSE|nr:hypothetical protein O3G_MSEX009426 [Manduca sexta]
MKHTIEIWRAKVKTEDKNVAYKAQIPDNKPKKGRHFESCVDYAAQTKHPKPSRMNYKKGKMPSLGAITASASTNCCACCVVLSEYIKEVFRLIILCPTNTKVVDLFCELLQIGGCLCNDCYYFLKKLFYCLLLIKK